MEKIQMVDLKNQYLNIKEEIDNEIQKVLNESDFINGKKVDEFANNLKNYMGCEFVVPCANGTDAIQIALMALGLKPGDEVIVPAFTYVATAEVVGLLGLIPVMVDVDIDSFCVTASNIEKAITEKSKAIVPVHLFGQCCDMEPIMKIANKHGLYVVEDNAQALGAKYKFSDGRIMRAGTIGDIGCTSFFPSKNLGCYGDGGAVFSNNPELATKMKMIANHGQRIKYHHDIIGCNSRLDTIQAAILDVKLKRLDEYEQHRYNVASYYTNGLIGLNEYLVTPKEMEYSTHVYHQYTLIINKNKRDDLKLFLDKNDIPSMVYYPLSLDQQNAFKSISQKRTDLSISRKLSESVLSLPIHTELNTLHLNFIIEKIFEFYK
jgi:dTDP-4-amino-4,6-dideoxygalactose transaminase